MLTFLSFREPQQVGRALAVSERARGRTLLDEVAGVDWRKRLSSDQRRQEQELREQLNARAYRREELLQRGESAAAALESEKLRSLEEQHRLLQRDLRRSIGLGTAAEPLSAEEIQALLDPGTALLSFHWTPRRVTLFWVTPERIEAFPLTENAEATAILARRVKRVLASVPNPETTFAIEAEGEARQLARALLGPVAPWLEGKRLVIVGDGPLLALPFASLPHPLLSARFLLENHEIVHLPSASLLGALRRRPPCDAELDLGLDLALFADPVYGESDERLGTENSGETRPTRGRSPRRVLSDETNSGLLGAWDRLPATAEEAHSLLAQLPPEARVSSVQGFEVRRDRVLEVLPRARRIHFATHGFSSPDSDRASGLVLSLFDPQGKPVDGLLRSRDIASQSLCAEQVVLSACRSGLGQELRGEGLLGLTHAFFLAGARSVVSAHWNINDDATAELMALYYRALFQDGLHPPAALRKAQLELHRNPRWKEPAHWAGFTVQGDWR